MDILQGVVLIGSREFAWEKVNVTVGATANPAAGSGHADITVPANRAWLLLGIESQGVMDANAANRYWVVNISYDGTNYQYRFSNPTAITASQTKNPIYTPGIPAELVLTGTSVMIEPFPSEGIELAAGAVISFDLVNGQAGDDWDQARYAYKERPS